jgi:hypothetical protein
MLLEMKKALEPSCSMNFVLRYSTYAGFKDNPTVAQGVRSLMIIMDGLLNILYDRMRFITMYSKSSALVAVYYIISSL